MSSLNDKLPAVILLLFALGLSGELITEWRFSPYDAGGQIAFALWICIGWVLFQRDKCPSLMLLTSSACLLLAGIITNLDVLVHASILVGSLQFLKTGPSAAIFVLAGVVWTPAFSYLLASFDLAAAHVQPVRTALSAIALILVLTVESVSRTSNRLSLNRGVGRG